MPPGFIVIDPTGFTPDQHRQLRERITIYSGWPHPDGVRWILPVEDVRTLHHKWVSQGWPKAALHIPT